MYLSVDCADRAAFDIRSGIPAVLRAHPHYTTLLTLDLDRLCPIWPVKPAPKSFTQPATLVLAGQYDPITPPAQGKTAAKHLSRSTFVEFPGLGHGVVLAHPCPESIFRTFLTDPTTTVDTTCVATMEGPQWR